MVVSSASTLVLLPALIGLLRPAFLGGRAGVPEPVPVARVQPLARRVDEAPATSPI